MVKRIKMNPSKKIINRFFKNVIHAPGDECWEYGGYKNKDGYCEIVEQVEGKRLYYLAHRLAAFLEGYDIKNKLVCHHCDNPSCVRPDHLFVGTHKDNMDDKVAKGRCAHGPDHSLATKKGIAAKGGMKACRGY